MNVELFEALLDSLKHPVLFVDTDHVIRFANKAAIAQYKKEKTDLEGHSIFNCHNENSKRVILEVFESFQVGEEERMIVDNERHRLFMCAVRDKTGELIGYYERFKPPKTQ